jgi:aspartate/methionine/tyrosine aminotransferase
MVSSVVKDIPISGIRLVMEWARKSGREDLIYLNMGEPDFITPDHIRKAAHDAIKQGHTHYTEVLGNYELREAIADKMKHDNRLDVDPESEILVTSGTQAAIFSIMIAMLDPGDEVIVPDPCYPPYELAIRMAGGVPCSIPLREENEFLYDSGSVEKRINDKTKLLLIISPSNPTGCLENERELKEIATIAESHNVTVISDELYEKIVYDDVHTCSISSVPGMKQRTIIVNGFSKTYAMTGWRVGYIVAPEEIIKQIKKVHHTMNVCAPSISQCAALAALKGSQACVQRMVKVYDKRRRMVLRYLDECESIHYTRPRGAFFVFPNIEDTNTGSVQFVKDLIFKYGVVVVPGLSFGKNSDRYIRISYSTATEKLKEAMERIKMFLS